MKTTVVVEFSHYEYEQLLALIERLAGIPENKRTKAEEAELRSLIYTARQFWRDRLQEANDKDLQS